MDGSENKGDPLGIVVHAYTPRYQAALDKLVGTEGAFVDDPLDHGGATKYGLSLRYLLAQTKAQPALAAKFDLDMDGDIDGRDVSLLTKGDAAWIYHDFFWQWLRCESWPLPLAGGRFMRANSLSTPVSVIPSLLAISPLLSPRAR